MNKEAKRKTTFVKKVSILLDNSLVDEINDILNAIKKEDRVYQNFTEFFRSAIKSYIDGDFKMNYERKFDGIKRDMTIRMNKEFTDFYNSIPDGQKTEWLESILGTYKGIVFGN